MMQSVRYSPNVLDVTIADNEDRGLVSTNLENLDKLLPARSEYSELQKGGLFPASKRGLWTGSRVQRDPATRVGFKICHRKSRR